MIPVLFGDVEMDVINFLRPLLPGVFVSRSVPTTRRDEMVIVRSDGGPQASLVSEAARVGVNVWAMTDVRATELARLVQMHFTTATNVGSFVNITNTGGPYALDDPSGQPLRYLTCEVLHKGTPPT